MPRRAWTTASSTLSASCCMWRAASPALTALRTSGAGTPRATRSPPPRTATRCSSSRTRKRPTANARDRVRGRISVALGRTCWCGQPRTNASGHAVASARGLAAWVAICMGLAPATGCGMVGAPFGNKQLRQQLTIGRDGRLYAVTHVTYGRLCGRSGCNGFFLFISHSSIIAIQCMGF